MRLKIRAAYCWRPLVGGSFHVALRLEMERIQATGGGWVEVRAYGNPLPGQRYGSLLFRHSVLLHESSSLEFTTFEAAYMVGLDQNPSNAQFVSSGHAEVGPPMLLHPAMQFEPPAVA